VIIKTTMKQILVDTALFYPDSDDLPVVVHGREGSGASFFSVMLAVLFCQTQPLFFWSAYPPAKEEFYKEFTGAIHRIKSVDEITGNEPQVIVMENGDPRELALALPKIDPSRIVFVKNFETVPKGIASELLESKRVIISGDMENALPKDEVATFPTRIFFSPYTDVDLPTLEKYQGYIFSAKKNGAIQVKM